MSAPTDPSPMVYSWIAKAEADYRAARHLSSMGKDASPEIVCFHAQQCVEKYLKAVLCLRDVHFPKTHDIGELFALLPKDVAVPLSVDDQETLTEYAVDSRYPGIESPIGLEEMTKCLKMMEKTRVALKEVLGYKD